MGAMHEVAIHGYGRRRICRGPCQGLLDWPEHLWTRITPRPIGLKRAIALASEHPYHAVVCVWQTAEKVYDNGRKPYVPAGWWPPTADDPEPDTQEIDGQAR